MWKSVIYSINALALAWSFLHLAQQSLSTP